MLLSNRLTFCIANLMALLLLVAVPVMAHLPAGDFDTNHDGVSNADPEVADLKEKDHIHHETAPMVSSITAEDTKGAVTAGGDLVSNVDGMNIVLVNDVAADDASRIVIALSDVNMLAGGGFILKITFDRDVYTAVGDENTDPALAESDLVPADITLTASAANAPTLNIGGTFTVSSVARVVTSAAGATPVVYSPREFLVTITRKAELAKAALPVSIWINVAADQVFAPTQLINGVPVQGRGNAGYMTPNPFMLNGYVAPVIPPDPPTPDPSETDAPTVTITPPNRVTTPGSTDDLAFTVTFSERVSALLESHLKTDGGTFVSAATADNGMTWTVMVDPTADPAEADVTVTLRDGSVADLEGNLYRSPTAGPDMGRYDTVNPTVNPIAGGPPAPAAAGAVTLQITFSEMLGTDMSAFTNDDIDRTNSNVLLTSTVPTIAATQPTDGTQVWELTVTPVPADAGQVIIVIKESSVADAVGNELEQDTIVTWTRPSVTPPTPDTTKPVVTVALASGMTYIDSVDGGNVMITATDNVAVTNAVMDAEITVANGSKGALSNNMIMVTPNVAATTVTVNVAAGAAMDAAGNGSNAVSITFNAGPIFTVPAGAGNANPGYLVITKTAGITHSYLSDQPTIHTSPQQTNPPTPVANINVGTWANMPDLERLFNTGSGNGGTLNIKAAATNGDAGTGNVRITEVMWAIDESMRGAANDAEANDQWVEIENPNGHAVQVIIYARTGLDSAITHNEAKIDRIGNAYNGGPGSTQWGVPGNNGNSYTGVDFVSMWRRYNENNRGKGYQNGTSSGAWAASSNIYLTSQTGNPNDGALYNHKGTPGRLQSVDLPNPSTRAGTTNPPSSPFVINEVANRDSGNAQYEWIEIKNVTNSTQNLRNYLISAVTATDHDNVLVELDNRNYNIPAGRVVLILTSDPRYDDDHPIAVGYNMDIGPPSDQVDGLGLIVEGSNRQPPLQIVQPFKRELPNDNNGRSYVLILRRPDGHQGHRSGAHGGEGVAETGHQDIDKIVDIAGHHEGLTKNNYPGTTPAGLNNTSLWPLINFSGHNRPHRGHGDWNHRRHNALDVNRVRYRQHVKTSARNDADGSDGVNRGGTGTTHKNEDIGHYAFRDANYTGLGYKRTARITGAHNGTPGYDGNTVGNTGVVKATAGAVSVSISEIMASTGRDADNPVLPQWIELYNSSPTDAVNLHNWKLRFEMLNADGSPMDGLMTLDLNKGRVKTIAPQQTVLIVAGNARQANSDAAAGTDVFNENRVFNVFRDYGGANKFGANTRYMFFNPKAFHMALLDKDNNVVDAVGNLDGDARTSDTNTWDYPEGVALDGNRTSFIRVYDGGKARGAVNMEESNVMPVFGTGDGKKTDNDGIDAKWAWIPAVNTEREFKITIRSTWYGVEDDYGTPNNRPGMVLPVELSFFRPTLEDGVVTVRWTTESELDNAGFNILRSETRDGEYTQVNTEMIQGAGTTGEKSTYKWVDPTAKPGVVYYYQIEDVSFAGERQALAITKLKGLISAENKLTTTWSELKASQ